MSTDDGVVATTADPPPSTRARSWLIGPLLLAAVCGGAALTIDRLAWADWFLGEDDVLHQPIVQDQLQLIRLRNTSPAFAGKLEIADTEPHLLHMTWTNDACTATLQANLRDHGFSISHRDAAGEETRLSFPEGFVPG